MALMKMPCAVGSGGSSEQWGCWTQYYSVSGSTPVGCVDTIATNEDCKLVCWGTGAAPTQYVTLSVENDYFTITCANTYPTTNSITITAKKNCTLLVENYDLTSYAIAQAYQPTSTSTLTLVAGNTYTINRLSSNTFAIKWIVQ